MVYEKLASKTLAYFVISCFFAKAYQILNETTNMIHFNGLNENSNFFNYLYFSLTTTTSVGYGDIYPISGIAKALVVYHQFLIILELEDIVIELFTIKF
tara:strand:- start:474 stop:770 length:297 start_codon:yes stop_codon:yes gene_type:complete